MLALPMQRTRGSLHPTRVLRKAGSLIDDVRRKATAGNRVLPDFVIVGAQKAGTTSLYNYLGQNPAVVPLRSKELHFFDNHLARGLDWYRSRFCTSEELDAASATAGSPAQTGEATPFYMFHPLAPKRMQRVIPDARLLLVLREPTERAYSHYQHERRKGVEALSFEEAIAAEGDRLAGELAERGVTAFDDPRSHQRHASYDARGHYAEQLERIIEYYPRDQLLVVLSDDLFVDQQRTYDRVCEFLGLPFARLQSSRPLNQGGYDLPTNSSLAALRPRFAESNAALADFGVEVPW